jgi:hypothetical protein
MAFIPNIPVGSGRDQSVESRRAFGVVSVSGQSDVVADRDGDQITLVAGSNVTITTDADAEAVTIAASGGSSFGTVAVSGQSDVIADAAPDTLTLAAGAGVTITTDAASDTVTIAASGGGHLHGLQRMLGDGSTTTFNLLDVAEYLEHIGVNGSIADPNTFTLSADGSQITFDSAPTAGQVLAMEYVIAGL